MKANPADQRLIGLLADGQFRTGKQLGEHLGISRAGVWKRMQRLQEWGLALESVKGKGYRLSRPLDLLDTDWLAKQLKSVDLYCHPVTDSTNADALLLPDSPRPQAVVAECQRQGRGRRGRQWQSPFAANLYLSVRYSLACGVTGLGGLSLAVGVAVAQTLASHCPGLSPVLKWPNDIWVNGAKLGGILVEVAGEMDGQVTVVVGVGINAGMTPDQAREIDQSWTDLASELGVAPPRTPLAAALLKAVISMLEQFSKEGFAPFVAAFEALDSCLDAPVTVQSGERQLMGVARGVSPEGALLLEQQGSLQEIHGGEVSLRKA